MKMIYRVICAIVLALSAIACEKEPDYGPSSDSTIASLGVPANNEIWFTTADGRELIYLNEEAFDVAVESVEYSEFGINVIRFAGVVTTIEESAFENCHNLFNISLPNSITTIGERAFFECINLECLTLGSGLLSCKAYAFDNCVALNSLHIPSIVHWCAIEFANPAANPASYAQMLVVEGNKVKKLVIPNGVERINDYAFIDNALLTEVTIPASVHYMGKQAFQGCSNIRKVATESVDAWCGIEFYDESANPITLTGELYQGNQLVTTLSLTSATEVKSRAFIRCSSIKSLTTGETTKTIGLEAFRGCTNLTEVTLSSATKEIDAKAFTGCMALKSVTSLAVQPPLLGDSNVFAYNADDRKIAVPSEALNAYLSDAMWSIYADSIEAIK